MDLKLSLMACGAQISDGGSVAEDVNFLIGQKFLENYVSAKYSSIIFGEI